MKKRNQYKVTHYKWKHLENKGEYLELSNEENKKNIYPSSENILFNTVTRVCDDWKVITKYEDRNDTAISSLSEEEYAKLTDEEKEEITVLNPIFVLNASSIKENNEEEMKLYERIMRKGVYIDGEHYIRFGKSSSMTMNQRTLFVKESLHNKLKEYISLGRTPENTIISKYETALGLTLSSLNLVEGIPNIAIVPDFERTIYSDVKIVDKFKPSEKDMETEEYKQALELEKKMDDYEAKEKELSELFTPEYLKNNFKVSNNNNHQSKSGWLREMRQVKMDELKKPIGYKQYNDNTYAVYSKEQTEEEDVKINKYNLGYEVNTYPNHPSEIEPFDGMALVSFEYAKKLNKALGIKHNANGYQFRLPYGKGLSIVVDYPTYFKEHGITEIEDIWGNMQPVEGLDMILTESCFKAKLDIDENNKKHFLFDSIEDYTNALKEYGHNYIGITDAIKPSYKTDIYTPLNYQFINSLNLSPFDIRDLAKKPYQLYKNIMRNGDVASVKAFLNMIVSEEDDNENEDDKKKKDRLDVDVKKAIDLHGAMIFDQRVKQFLLNQVKRKVQELAYGVIPVKGDYKYVTGDVIALMEWIAYRDKDKVKGFLNAGEFFCKDKSDEHVLMRNPMTSWHEVVKANFVDNNSKYLKHLNNVVLFNTWDLSMTQASGLDYDGDKCYCSFEPVLVKNRIKDLVIVNPEDKETTNPQKYGIDEIINFEKKNLNNMTPIVTNINTLIQSFALEKGDLRTKELEIATCKQLQAEFIDSVKKGTNPKIPRVLEKYQYVKPYFQKFIYEDMEKGYSENKYRKIRSPLNLFSQYKAEGDWFEGFKNKRSFTHSKENPLSEIDTYNMVRDRSKFNFKEKAILDLVKKVEPIYNEFANKKIEINNKEKKINRVNPNENEKEELEAIKDEWKALYEKTRSELQNVCDNPSMLTTACITHEYKIGKDSFIFGWIATEGAEGVLENIRAREADFKVDAIPVPQLDRQDQMYGDLMMTVEGGIGYFEDVEDCFEVKLDDGEYPIIEQMGYHFAEKVSDRSSKVETSHSPDGDFTDMEIEPLQEFKTTLVGLRVDDIKDYDDSLVKIIEDNKYLNVFVEGEMIAGISTKGEERYDSEKGIGIADYTNQLLKMNIVDVNKKSVKITLDSIEERPTTSVV